MFPLKNLKQEAYESRKRVNNLFIYYQIIRFLNFNSNLMCHAYHSCSFIDFVWCDAVLFSSTEKKSHWSSVFAISLYTCREARPIQLHGIECVFIWKELFESNILSICWWRSDVRSQSYEHLKFTIACPLFTQNGRHRKVLGGHI